MPINNKIKANNGNLNFEQNLREGLFIIQEALVRGLMIIQEALVRGF